MPKSNQLDPIILEQAIDWLMHMQEQSLTDTQQEQFERWKNQSVQHQLAWQRTEKLQHHLGNIPSDISKKVLKQKSPISVPNGKLILLIVCGSIITSVTYLTKQHAWLADHRTPFSEQRHIILEDGTQLTLNSKTAIDIKYTATERQIILYYGEIYIETAKESNTQYRPFKVLNKHGSIQALGTQFSVKQEQSYTTIAVMEHAVSVNTANSNKYLKLHAGQQINFDIDTIYQVQPVQLDQLIWRKGLFVANRIKLADFAKQLSKYYGVTVEMSSDVSDIQISGTYPTDNLDRLLLTLNETYALQADKNLFCTQIVFYKIK